MVDGKAQWEPRDRTDRLLSELNDLEAVLVYAIEKGAKFRIYIGE